jgi:hypothetical protein
MQARTAAREEARRLRAQGMSLREIAVAVGAALSSVSVWTRDIASSRVLLERVGATPLEGRRLPIADLNKTRRCGRCGTMLPLCAFGRGQYRCRRCLRDYFRERGDFHRTQSGAALAARRLRAKQHLLTYLEAHPCVDCGEADPVVLEFDHVRGKKQGLATLTHGGASTDRLDDEIALCEVVCVCCHRRRTAARRPPPGPLRPGRRRNAKYAQAVLERSKCIDCGETDVGVLDFDHVGRKTSSIADLIVKEGPLAVLAQEINCCVVRCANCHRRKTSVTGGHFRSRHA